MIPGMQDKMRATTKMNAMLSAELFVAILLLAAVPARAQQPASSQPAPLHGVGITQRMNQQVPGDLLFRDETGRSVHLGDYFGKKPIVLSLVYFNCPFMCTEVLNGELRALQGVPLELGGDYQAVTVSFDPKDGPPQANLKNRIYTGMYQRPTASGGWHFLTGSQDSIQALTDAVGFGYAYDQPSGQFAHATAIMILTPEGRVSRYFYGVQYPPRDVRLGLVEASEGRIGSPTDAALLFCFHYDPMTGKYGLVIANVIRIAGAVTLLVLGIFLFLMFRQEKYGLRPPRALQAAAAQGFKTNVRPGWKG
jgi:protein SCO1